MNKPTTIVIQTRLTPNQVVSLESFCTALDTSTSEVIRAALIAYGVIEADKVPRPSRTWGGSWKGSNNPNYRPELHESVTIPGEIDEFIG